VRSPLRPSRLARSREHRSAGERSRDRRQRAAYDAQDEPEAETKDT
jgi:hypothetical protein